MLFYNRVFDLHFLSDVLVHVLHCFTCTLYSKRCIAADPFLNDQNFILSVLSLEELGATGNKVLSFRIVFCSLTFSS